MREPKGAKAAKRTTVSGGRFVVKEPQSVRVPGGTIERTSTVSSGRQQRVKKIVGEHKETFRALARK